MPTAYADSSVIVCVVFDEPSADETRRRLTEFDTIVSSNLLEAEVRAAFAREQLEFDLSALHGIDWLIPDQPLATEMTIALSTGYLRGSDLWHVATALHFFPERANVTFLSLDNRQKAVAEALGFLI